MIRYLKGLYILIKLFYFYPLLAYFKSIGTKVDLHDVWPNMVCKYLNIKFQKIDSGQLREGKTLFLCNHRSQGDFFIHDIITNHRPSVLARMAVAVVFPAFYIFEKGTLWFFKRTGNIDHKKFNEWLDQKFRKSPRDSLMVYPQGHRMYDAKKVEQVKTGLIKYAYSRDIPVQLIMSFGNQNVMNEKKLQFSFNQTVYYGIGKSIHPKDFLNQKQFVQVVVQSFKAYFSQIYQKAELQKQKSK